MRSPAALALSLCALVLLAVVGCKGKGDGAATAGSSVFRYNESEGLNTLDPAQAGRRASIWATQQIFEGLIELDAALTPQPLLASRWDVSDSGRTYTFHLRPGVRFHDDPAFPGGKGRVLVARDVKASFERVLTPSVKSTGSWVFTGKIVGADAFYSGSAGDVAGFEAPDDSTFRLRLVRPFPPILSLLSMPYGFVVPTEVAQKAGPDFARHPVGTGPFRFASWRDGVSLKLERNPDYWAKAADGSRLPTLDGVEVTFQGDERAAFLEFQRGTYHMIDPLSEEFVEQVIGPDGKLTAAYADYTLVNQPYLNTEYYGFFLGQGAPASTTPLSTNRKLRQALNYAVDRKRIVTYVLHGLGTPGVYGPVPPGLPGFDSTLVGYSYDPAKAKALLAEAGYPGGRGLPELTLQIDQKRGSIAEAVQAMLREVGVRVTIQKVQFGQHLSMVKDGKVPFWGTSWIADYPDAENYLACFTTSNFSPDRGPNTTHFSSRQVDQLYEQALVTTDPAERRAVYAEAQRLILDEAPWLILYYDRIARLLRPEVHGLVTNAQDQLVLKTVSLGPPLAR